MKNDIVLFFTIAIILSIFAALIIAFVYIICRFRRESFKGKIIDNTKRELVHNTFISPDGFEGKTNSHFEYYFEIKPDAETINVRSLYHHRKVILNHLYAPNKNVTVFITKNKSINEPKCYIFKETVLHYLPRILMWIIIFSIAFEALYYRFI